MRREVRQDGVQPRGVAVSLRCGTALRELAVVAAASHSPLSDVSHRATLPDASDWRAAPVGARSLFEP